MAFANATRAPQAASAWNAHLAIGWSTGRANRWVGRALPSVRLWLFEGYSIGPTVCVEREHSLAGCG